MCKGPEPLKASLFDLGLIWAQTHPALTAQGGELIVRDWRENVGVSEATGHLRPPTSIENSGIELLWVELQALDPSLRLCTPAGAVKSKQHGRTV